MPKIYKKWQGIFFVRTLFFLLLDHIESDRQDINNYFYPVSFTVFGNKTVTVPDSFVAAFECIYQLALTGKDIIGYQKIPPSILASVKQITLMKTVKQRQSLFFAIIASTVAYPDRLSGG